MSFINFKKNVIIKIQNTHIGDHLGKTKQNNITYELKDHNV